MEPEFTFVQDALPGLVAIVVSIICIILNTVSRKIGSKADAQTRVHIQEAMLNVTLQSIALAEQLSVKYSKVNDGTKLDSDFKLETAVKYTLDEMRRLNLPELSVAQVEEKIESYLGVGALSTMHHGGSENAIYEE